MKTPHAILIGLSLIAAAIYFKDTAVKPAYAFGDRQATYNDVKSIVYSCVNGAKFRGSMLYAGTNCR